MKSYMNPLTIKAERSLKILLAVWIVISHSPIAGVVATFNYLPVAVFFFLSGYGLEKKMQLKKIGGVLSTIF